LIDIFIPGTPAPQGSKTYLGRGVLVESCKRVKPWRADVRSALMTDNGKPIEVIDGPVFCSMIFVMPRPKSTPKKSTPPAIKRPDLDKLVRAVFDAVKSAGVIADDSVVVRTVPQKRIAEIGETPGLWLRICSDSRIRLDFYLDGVLV
jgi:crossover junction endodeoxyribonuclease RusA